MLLLLTHKKFLIFVVNDQISTLRDFDFVLCSTQRAIGTCLLDLSYNTVLTDSVRAEENLWLVRGAELHAARFAVSH